MQDLFVLAFVDGQKNPSKRPDTVTWYNALTQYQQNLSTCSKDKSHMYSSHLRKCPWCEVESRLKAVVPVTPPPQNTATSNPATWTYSNPALPNTPPRQGGGNVQNSNDGIMASSGMFWFLILAIPLAIQAIILSVYGEELITALFGSRHGSGIESWGVNIAVAIGPWGFVICGIIGTCLYNSYASKNASGGYKAYNYVLSIISSLLSAVAWVLVVFLVFFSILIIALIFVVVVICNHTPSSAPKINRKCFILCWRCTGVIVGALLLFVALFYMNAGSNISLELLLIPLAFPAPVDYVLIRSGIIPPSNRRRFVTGVLLGIPLSFPLYILYSTV